MKKRNILYICTGNTCRSPMAEAISKEFSKIREIEDIHSFSRGLSVFYPSDAAENAILALDEEYNIILKDHNAREISLEDIKKADMILTMTISHKEYLETILKNQKLENKDIYTINELAINTKKDISDPYGGSLETYKETAREIYNLLTIIFDKIEKGEIL